MLGNVPVDDGDLIMSISAVRQHHSTTACHNVVDCLQACTAHIPSRTHLNAGCGAHNVKSEELGLEQPLLVCQLQREGSKPSTT